MISKHLHALLPYTSLSRVWGSEYREDTKEVFVGKGRKAPSGTGNLRLSGRRPSASLGARHRRLLALAGGLGAAVVLSASVALALAAPIILCASAALAHPAGVPHDDSPLSLWFARQHSLRGGWCCDLSDAYYLGDDDWTAARDGYRVRIGDRWVPVPPDRVRDPAGGPNPTGNAIVWYGESGGAVTIYCFSPGWVY